MKNKKPQRKELDPKGGQWYRELKALNPPATKAEAEENSRKALAFVAARHYRERLTYTYIKGGHKVIIGKRYDRIIFD